MNIRCAHCRNRHASAQEVRDCAHYEAEAAAEMAAERRYERWLEDGGPHAAQIQWENEQDMLMHPFDPQTGVFATPGLV